MYDSFWGVTSHWRGVGILSNWTKNSVSFAHLAYRSCFGQDDEHASRARIESTHEHFPDAATGEVSVQDLAKFTNVMDIFFGGVSHSLAEVQVRSRPTGRYRRIGSHLFRGLRRLRCKTSRRIMQRFRWQLFPQVRFRPLAKYFHFGTWT